MKQHVMEVMTHPIADPRACNLYTIFTLLLDGVVVREQISYIGMEEIKTEAANHHIDMDKVIVKPLPPSKGPPKRFKSATSSQFRHSSLSVQVPVIHVLSATLKQPEVKPERKAEPIPPLQRQMLALLSVQPPELREMTLSNPNGGVRVGVLAQLLNTLRHSALRIANGLRNKGLVTVDYSSDPVVALTQQGIRRSLN